MTTFVIDDVHDITIDTNVHETYIDCKDIRGSTARIIMRSDEFDLLLERGVEARSKYLDNLLQQRREDHEAKLL